MATPQDPLPGAVVRRDGLLAVAALLAVGILVAAVGAWLRSGETRSEDPASRMPSRGLLISLRGEDLRGRVAELSRYPVYRELFGSGMAAKIRRVLRWNTSVPDPWDAVPSGDPSALAPAAGGQLLQWHAAA